MYATSLFLLAAIYIAGAVPVQEPGVHDPHAQLSRFWSNYYFKKSNRRIHPPSGILKKKANLESIDVDQVSSLGQLLDEIYKAYNDGDQHAEAEGWIKYFDAAKDLYDIYQGFNNDGNQVARAEYWNFLLPLLAGAVLNNGQNQVVNKEDFPWHIFTKYVQPALPTSDYLQQDAARNTKDEVAEKDSLFTAQEALDFFSKVRDLYQQG